jgi:hypothetical protein
LVFLPNNKIAFAKAEPKAAKTATVIVPEGLEEGGCVYVWPSPSTVERCPNNTAK